MGALVRVPFGISSKSASGVPAILTQESDGEHRSLHECACPFPSGRNDSYIIEIDARGKVADNLLFKGMRDVSGRV